MRGSGNIICPKEKYRDTTCCVPTIKELSGAKNVVPLR